MMKNDTFLTNLVERVEARKTFQAMMQDGKIEDHEVDEQANLVQSLMTQVEKQLNKQDFALVVELLAEMSVLQVVTSYNQIN